MADHQFRTASVEDIPQLVGLLNQLFAQEVEFTPNEENQKRGLLKIILNEQVGKIIVAESYGSIIGMVNLLFTVSTSTGTRVCILEDMIISSNCRSSGVGSQLLQYSISVARNDGCLRITLLTDRENEKAHKFYQRHGFKFSLMIPMRLNLQ